MWNLHKLTLKNFQSHEDTEVTIKNDCVTMLYGRYADVTLESDSNGSGKSCIIKAITIALVGFPDKQLSKDEYVNDNANSCIIVLELYNKQFDKKLKVMRNFYSNSKSSKATLEEDGVINKELISWDDVTKRLLDLLDISKDDLLNYFIINQSNSHSFFKSTDGEQKKIISRFTNLKLLDDTIKLVKADASNIEQEIEQQKQEIEKNAIKVANFQDQIIYENEGRKNDLIEQLQEVADSLEEKNVIVEGLTAKLKVLNKRLIEENKALSVLKESKVDVRELKTNKAKVEETITSLEEDLKTWNKECSGYSNMIAGAITCPKCHHEFTLNQNAKESISTYRKLLIKLSAKIEECEQSIEIQSKNKKRISEELRTERDKVETIEEQELALRKISRQIKESQENIIAEHKMIEAVKKNIDELNDFTVNKKRIKELEASIVELEREDVAIENNISTLSNTLEDLRFWIVNFDISGLKTYLINKTLSNIEGYMNYNLKKFKTDLSIKINGYKRLKSGDMREEIEILVEKRDRGWKKFKSYSGGQQQRVNVCGILTLQKKINQTSKYGGLNFLALDEFFEGLDIKGQRMVLPVLEMSGITTLVVSHHNNDIGAKNQIVVVYEDGISKILR